MTEVERVEDHLATFQGLRERLEKCLEDLREYEGQITMDLNRARRLEREAKELHDV